MLKKMLAVILTCILLPLKAQATPAPKMEELRLMLEWFVNPDHGPIIIAKEKGYFEQEGVRVTLQEPADPDLPPKLVAAGDVDLAVYYQTSLIRAAGDNLPLSWAGTLIASPLDGLLVLKDGPIRSLADMKGKSVGFSVNGVEKANLDTMLKPYGLSHKDVKLVNVGWNLSASLMTGKVDALLGAYRNFELNNLKLYKKPGKMFYMEELGVPAYDELIFIAHTQKANKEAIRRFLRAVERGAQFIVNNPEKAWVIFKNYSPDTLDNDLNRMAWKDTVSHFSLRPAAKDVGRYERYAQYLVEHKEIKKKPDMSKLMLGLY